MKINVLGYINEAAAILDGENETLTKLCDRICKHLSLTIGGGEEILDVTGRIKGKDSLKEKIVRKDLYKKFSANDLLFALSDIIGIRIECRFLSEERKVYEKLRAAFAHSDDGIYYYADKKPSIQLKLSSLQPEKQLNGLDIYRIDGFVTSKDVKYNFELQIKALVNSFWSEIEHKIIYKNKRFMMIDNFVSELMASLNKNLQLIDNQLYMLYERCVDNSRRSQRGALNALLCTFINGLFSAVVEKHVGFPVNIKSYTESLVEYVFLSSSFSGIAENDLEQDIALMDGEYAKTLLKTLEWMRMIDFTSVHPGDEILLSLPPAADQTESILTQTISAHINEDFFMNMFFHILFSIEVGNDVNDFISYIRYLRARIVGKNNVSSEELKAALSQVDTSKLILIPVMEQVKQLLTEEEKQAPHHGLNPANKQQL